MSTKKLNLAESITPTGDAPHITKNIKELAKEKLSQLMKEEMKTVKGIFKCYESPGGGVRVIVRKYPGVQPFEMYMVDGMQYEVPLYVARHLNGTDITAGACADESIRNPKIGTCSYPVHGFKWGQGTEAPKSGLGFGPSGEGGIPVPIVGVAKRFQRYGFQSLEFEGSYS